MISRRLVFEIRQLQARGFSRRSIARQLGISRETVMKYLADPYPADRKKRAPRPSRLDPYREMITAMIEECPDIKAPVVLRQLRKKGFTGGITIVRDLLRRIRGTRSKRKSFIRFESQPGQQMQIDWGYFGTLDYGHNRRRLYGLVILEGYSRMLHVFFSHSQKQDYLHPGLLEAFIRFDGIPEEIVVDNMLTAVTERVGTIIRFNEAFLDFLGRFSITPHACTVRSPYEKGKVERAISYIRQNFLPLKRFTGLTDAQKQMCHWLDTVANSRQHQTTGQRPVDRLQGLRPLPDPLPDCRQVCSLLVHKDFGVRFDTNVYTVPPWAIGRQVTLKADTRRIWIYQKEKLIACHPRCWDRRQRIELDIHREQVKKLKKRVLRDRQVIVFLSLGEPALRYLQLLSGSGLPIRKNIAALLDLQDEYGDSALLHGLESALKKKLPGADYVRNILYQKMTPVNHHPPVRLKQEELNTIRLTTPALADYDAVALKKRNNHA